MLRFSGKNGYNAGILSCLSIVLLWAASCRKYTDEPGQNDPRLSRRYCNDPEAVNYNRNFPGTADNSVCFFPADAFKGQYTFTDSIYGGNNILIARRPLVLSFSAGSRTKISVLGFCGGGTTPVTFTANRALRAAADTTILNGQLLCRPKDTLSGYITQSLSDSTRLRIFLTVVSDTGTTFHQGTAYRQ